MKQYVSLTTDAMKRGNKDFYSDHNNSRLRRGKVSSLGNSMLNHSGHVTLTSWIFVKLLPVVGVIEI